MVYNFLCIVTENSLQDILGYDIIIKIVGN